MLFLLRAAANTGGRSLSEVGTAALGHAFEALDAFPLGAVDPFEPAAYVVEIEGRFFARSPILAVRFGDREATDVTVVSDTLLRCTPPAALPGPVDVVVESALPTVALERGFVYTPGIVTEPTVAPGTVLALDVALERPGDFVVVVLGTPTQNGTTIPGIDRTLDVANETVLWIVPSWPGTSLPVRIPIADDPSLIGVAALFQAASGVPGRATWSNAVRVEIAR